MPYVPPIISGYLPRTPHTPYQSGYAFLRSSPVSNFSISSPTLLTTSAPALEIKEVGYSIFYPAAAAKHGGGGGGKKYVYWVPEPESGVVEGYEKFIGPRGMKWMMQILRLVVGRMKIQALPLAPVATSDRKYPLVIFSHGLAGTRHTYSQYCSGLAASGYVVLAVEHRDGSGPAVMIPNQEKGGELELRTYIDTKELNWVEGKSQSKEKFRSLQLDMRVREVYEVYHSFRRLLEGEGGQDDKTIIADPSGEAGAPWLRSLRGMVDVEDVQLTGHSFGGGTMLHLLQTPPPSDPLLPPIPAKRCIALDPWMEPLPLPTKPSGPPPKVPVLVINSQGFTEWTGHFDRLLGMIKGINGDLVTLYGSTHQTFSDFPVLIPGSPTFAISLLQTIHDLSSAFLSGNIREAPQLKGKEADGGKVDKGEDGKMSGIKGEVYVHLVGRDEL